MSARFVPAPFWIAWFLRRNEFWAIPNPFTQIVYCLPQHIDDPIMRGHELVHFEQIDRDGLVRFCVQYLWWAWKFGYYANPYEVEAYQRFSY
jgi:hypothetical protein